MHKVFDISTNRLRVYYMILPLWFYYNTQKERYFSSYASDQDIINGIIIVVVSTIIGVILAEIFVRKLLVPALRVEVTEDQLITYGMAKRRIAIDFVDLVGPMESEYYLITKYSFQDMQKKSPPIVFTSYTKNHRELLKLIQEKIVEACHEEKS